MKVLAEYNPVDAPGVFYTASVAEVPEQQNRCEFCCNTYAYTHLTVLTKALFVAAAEY